MRVTRQILLFFGALLTVLMAAPQISADEHDSSGPTVEVLAEGLNTPVGSAIGPDGALYVPNNADGTIVRVDTDTGDTSIYASGLPTAIAPIGGPVDLVFRDGTAYILVSLVGPFFGSEDITGIYRMDGPSDYTVIADLGTWAAANQQAGVEWDAPITSGVHTAIENYDNGFLVTDAHNNLLLHIDMNGTIEPHTVLGNVAPAGMEIDGNEIHVALTGPIPHLPEDGQIMSTDSTGAARLVAAGAPLLLDVERGPGGLYGLAQGPWSGAEAGDPSNPNSGSLVKVGPGGQLTTLIDGLNLPTSIELQGNTAYLVSLDGTITRITNYDPDAGPTVEVLAEGLNTPVGSAIGPDGALYVPNNADGTIVRVDTDTGDTSIYASGLPTAIAPIGGPVDLVFRDGTAYILVSLVGPFFGSEDITGIYRMDGPSDYTVIADLGTWAAANQQAGVEWDAPITSGVHTAIENYDNGFLVTDAHNNLLLHIDMNGTIEPHTVLGNVAPAGMEIDGNEIHVALTGPIPHLPEDGQIMSTDSTGAARLVAAGAPLLLDVERGPGGLYGLAQGPWSGAEAGDPSNPNSGSLVKVGPGGQLTTLIDGLNLPTSIELQGNTAYLVSLDGTITRITNYDPDLTDDVGAQCAARTALVGLEFHNRSTGESSSDLGNLAIGAGDTIEMTWQSAAAGQEDCVVSLALYRTSAGYFDRSENQQLAVADMSTAGDTNGLSITAPADIQHMQIDAVLGRPLMTVGPNGDYYSQYLNGVKTLLIDHWNG